MVIRLNRTQWNARADTAERAQPRSLQLALTRMGFRPLRQDEHLPGWPSTWSQRPRDEAANDWRPL